jgi:hypothetical protein
MRDRHHGLFTGDDPADRDLMGNDVRFSHDLPLEVVVLFENDGGTSAC